MPIMCWALFKHFRYVNLLIQTTILGNVSFYYYYTHFTDEKTESQEIIRNLSHIKELHNKRQNWDSSTENLALESLLLTTL